MIMCLCTPHPEPGPRCPSDWPSSAQQTVVLAGRGKRCQGRKRERESEEEEEEKDGVGEDGERRGKNAPFTVGAPACPRPPEGSPLFLPLSLWCLDSCEWRSGYGWRWHFLCAGRRVCVWVSAERLDAITTVTLLEAQLRHSWLNAHSVLLCSMQNAHQMNQNPQYSWISMLTISESPSASHKMLMCAASGHFVPHES